MEMRPQRWKRGLRDGNVASEMETRPQRRNYGLRDGNAASGDENAASEIKARRRSAKRDL